MKTELDVTGRHHQPAGSSAALFTRQEMALVGVTMLWGFTFLIVHYALVFTGPLFFVGVRFTVGGLATMLVFRRCMTQVTWHDVRAGLSIGIAMCIGYCLMTYGLQSIEASKSAFLTALYVLVVPLLQWILVGTPPHRMAWLGICLAFLGLALVSSPSASQLLVFGVGETVTLLGAVAIAAEILLIGRYAGKVNLQCVTAIQLLAAGLFAFLAMPLVDEGMPAFSWVWLIGAVGLGAMSALIQLTMNWAQKSVPPTRATLIYATEPVWAAAVGRVAGERLPGMALIGAVFILAGVIASEMRPRWFNRSLDESSMR